MNVEQAGEAQVNVQPAAAPQVNVTPATEADVNVNAAEPVVDVTGADTTTATDAASTTAAATATGAATGAVVAPVMATDVVVREGYESVPAGEVAGDELTGADVYAAGDEDIGEVKDVVADPSGQIQQVIVGVGGFLGIGERDVAYPFDQVSLQRNADGSDLRVYVGTTAEQVKDLPPYTAPAN